MRRLFSILALLLIAFSSLGANVYSQFGPSNGILKGSVNSYLTTSATSADVLSLWSGTCNSSTFMRGDGACAAAGGTVSSVGLSMPGIFTVTGSPVTSSGTLTATAAGTSGGIPYFDSATTLASSALLTSNAIVLGGGAGGSPITYTDFIWNDASQIFTLGGTGNPTVQPLASASAGKNITLSGGTGVNTSTAGSAYLSGGSVTLGTGDAGNAIVSGGVIIGGSGTPGSVLLRTTGFNRFQINSSGAFGLGSSPSYGTSGQVLTSQGSSAVPIWTTPSSGANPSNSIGLTAVNGSAVTFMRSDAAPALSQSISPVWTGSHTFSGGIRVVGDAASSLSDLTLQNTGASGHNWRIGDGVGVSNGTFAFYDQTSTALRGQISSSGNWTIPAPSSGIAFTANGVANSFTGRFVGSSTSGQSRGLQVNAGTNSSDYTLNLTNQANTTDFMSVYGDGHFGLGYNGSSFTLTGSASGALANNGFSVPHFAAATAVDNGTTCSFTSAANVASCTRNSTGNITVTFTSNLFTTAFACTATTTSSGEVAINSTTTGASNNVNLLTFAADWTTAAARTIHLTCMGT